MKLETFKPGRWQQRLQYKSFEPAPVNHDWHWEDARINVLLEAANRALGELNAFSLIVPDIDLFIEMHVVKEAQTSSRIEGTQTGIDEAVLPEEQVKPEKRDDWREVRNYIDAANYAIAELRNLPLSNRLLRQTHAILLRGARGEHKQPGEFRLSQNWIGGSSLADAAFIPPHHEGVPEQMGDLEAFWHNQAIAVPHLIRIAISHYQFETIHPFLDGNGRTSRLLSTLCLYRAGYDFKRLFTISEYYDRNRSAFYHALQSVREQEMDLTGWLEYFVAGLETQLEEVKERGKKAIQLDVLATERQLNARQVDALRYLLLQELMSIQDFERIHPSVARRTLQRDLKDLLVKELIAEVGQASTDPNRRYRMMFDL